MARERRERINGPYKHGNKFRIVVTRADGEQTTQSFKTEAEAQRVAHEARTQAQGRSLMIAVDAYEVEMRERGLAGCTIERHRYHLDRLLQTKTHGHRPLTWLTPKRARQLYDESRAGAAPDTHRNGLKVGRSFGRFAVDRGWLPADPFAKVVGVGKRRRGKPQLHIDEGNRLIAACYAERSRESIAVATGLLLGYGASEVTQRQVRDLDNGGRVLHVTKGKNGFRVRSVEVPDELRPFLLELAKGRPGSAYLFGTGDIDRPSRYWIYWHCKRLCAVAKVPPVSPHGLRGTHATIAVGTVATSHSVSAALRAAGASLGHAPGSPITATTYVAPGAVDAARQRAVMRVLDGSAGNSAGNDSADSRYQRSEVIG